MQRRQIQIRKAKENDARAIIQVHHDAVHLTAANDYDKAILDDWSNVSDARVENMRAQIKDNPEDTLMLVAEIGQTVVGFGEIFPKGKELRAVYVSPSAGRMGIGRAILEELEIQARKVKVPSLWLDSSITAEPFYLAQGYSRDERSEHVLRSGRLMTCIKMHKNLS